MIKIFDTHLDKVGVEDFCCHHMSRFGYIYVSICLHKLPTCSGEHFSTVFGLLLYDFSLSMRWHMSPAQVSKIIIIICKSGGLITMILILVL